MKRMLYILIMWVFLSGCATVPINIYPVEGPLAGKGIILKSKYVYTGTGHGPIEVVMPDGEVCKGEYSTIAGGVTGTSFGFGGLFTAQQYTSLLGSGFMSAVENKQYGQATLIGDKGTIVQVEYFTSLTGHGFGLGKDNKGNIYRIQY